ncbi:putative transporter YfdV [uncultured Roseburia sp.]|uniref:AEC family transporter n=1 Tax=Brotonthovivens ammoniilytica TaxID=2981725 RepID=A0ABT2TM08_9FIRM|nr:AEC family transporter [Brotonthovivens ammoniilytica]MCU6763122.1 AEC family transporter [Brotonthovivens ammoniilytica]SCJ03938.1 putative transporter YfdV [uncultured Roseburia sp.]
MNNLLFSVNVTIPIFLVMVLGYVLRRIGMLNDNFVTIANKFNFKVTLPFLLFRDLSTVDIQNVFDLKFVLFCAVSTTICFWGVWGLAKIFMKDKTMIGAFTQASFRSSAAVMGLAFIQNIYGSATMGSLMIIGAVPLYNIFSVLVLTFEGSDPKGDHSTGRLKQAGINILKNPIIIAIVLGLIVALLHNPLPTLINKTVSSTAQMATPLALIALGAGFEGKKALAKIKPTLASAFIKLIAQAAIFVPIAAAFGFRGEKMVALVIMLAAPATPSCYIMAKNMNNDGVLTASIVVTTTLLAAVTLTGWIFILKSVGWI